MLSRRGANIVFVLMLSGAMAAIMSLAMTIINTGVDGHLMARWLRNFVIAWMIAFPSALLLVPPIRRFADSMVR
ncbi:MAG: DUF2798 domain-containing protein [Phycisphaerales bacterium]|nr:DUF2798 domain-containing protein [Phycisphaerales bacterium]